MAAEIARPPGEVEDDSSSSSPRRTIYLLVYPNRLFRAHWSIMVPLAEGDLSVSTRIHVTGDVLNGFQHDIERRYKVYQDDRRPRMIALGRVARMTLQQQPADDTAATASSDAAITTAAATADGDEADPSTRGCDSSTQAVGPSNLLEAVALGVQPPGPGLRSTKKGETSSAGARGAAAAAGPNREDCQSWVSKVVRVLVERGLLEPNARDVVDTAPQH